MIVIFYDNMIDYHKMASNHNIDLYFILFYFFKIEISMFGCIFVVLLMREIHYGIFAFSK